MNLTTAHGTEARRFLKAFYATPELEFRPSDKFTGVLAQTSGAYLRIVNPTAFPVTGVIRAKYAFRDLVWDRDHASGVRIELLPYDVRIFRSTGSSPEFSGEFRFDAERERLVSADAARILASSDLRARIAPEFLSALDTASKRKDYPACRFLMDHFEIASKSRVLFNSTREFENQAKLESMLREKGAARINCACSEETTDDDDNLWLPDQTYRGFAFYGNEYAIFADRGAVPVSNTRAPRMSTTEAFGANSGIYYRIPVPAGTYRVRVHFAELWHGHKELGRTVEYTLNGRKQVLRTVTAAVPYGRSQYAEWSGVTPKRGKLSLQILGTVGINGIEIFTEEKNVK